MRITITIIALWAAGLGAAAQFGKLSVLFNDILRLYPGHSAVEMGFLLSVVGVVGILFGTTASLLVARIGARRGIVSALIAGAAISWMQMSLPSYPVFLASRLLEGMSHLFIVVIAPGVIAGLAAARWQGAAMTLWSSFFGLTYAALFQFAPGLVKSQGPAILFQLHVLWMLAIAAALWILLPRDVRPPAALGAGGLWAQHRTIYASAWIAAPAMGFICYTITYVALLTLLPAQMGEAGAFLGVAMPLVSIAVSLSLGVLMLRWFHSVTVVQIGFVTAILGGVALGLTWGGPGAVWSALVLSAGLGVVQGASFAALAQLNQTIETRARAAGAIAQLGNVGTTLGTPILAYLVARNGMPGIVAFVVGFSALGIVLHLVQARRRTSG